MGSAIAGDRYVSSCDDHDAGVAGVRLGGVDGFTMLNGPGWGRHGELPTSEPIPVAEVLLIGD